MSEPGGGTGSRAPGLERLSLILAGSCALIAVARAAAVRGWIPSPAIPWHIGDIAVWALGGFCILWGMERGMPEGEAPRPALRLYRLGVLVAAFAMLAVWVYA